LTKKKKKNPVWADVEKKIKNFNKDQFIELLADLYRLSKNNKEFFHTRFCSTEDPLKYYKRIIQDAIHPYLEGNEVLDVGLAEDAVDRYSKAVDDIMGETELMVFFVECGNNFTLSYGDIDDDFYDSLVQMYGKAVQNVTKLPANEQAVFKNRLHEIMDSASGIGWGYYDGLRELYLDAFSNDS
jgi:hypothetical protein